MVPGEEGKHWSELRAEKLTRQGRADGGRWRGTLFEPVPGTKLCEFLDTKKEVSAVGSNPNNDTGYPLAQEICCCL